MPPQILDYIKTQRVGVLAVEMLDGSPHAATIHFAHDESSSVFYFETSKDSLKGGVIISRELTRASFVLGTIESSMKTLQIDGELRLVNEIEVDKFKEIYFGKFPEKATKVYDSPQIYLRFTASWWRFTDWTGPEGKLILTS